MLVNYNVANENTISNGDYFSIHSENCVEGGLTVNGGLAIRFGNVGGTPQPNSVWSATMYVAFNNFSITLNNVTESANGDLPLAYSQTAQGVSSFSASGSSLQLGTVKAGTTVTRTISDYSYFGSATASRLHTYRANYTLTGSFPRLGSNLAYTVRAVKNFKRQGASNPYDGVLTMTASDNTSLTFTVTSTSNVEIGIDRNGDGTIDETRNASWSEITSLL